MMSTILPEPCMTASMSTYHAVLAEETSSLLALVCETLLPTQAVAGDADADSSACRVSGRLETGVDSSTATDELSERLRPSSVDPERGVFSRLLAQRGAEPPSYTHSRSRALHREHFGRSPLHLVLLTRQLLQERYVRILRSDASAERWPAVVPSSSTQSSWSRSQLRQPLGRPSHFTCLGG